MDEPDNKSEIEFDSDALEFVRVAEDVARRLISHPKTTPRQLCTLAKALRALELMPQWVMNGYITYGVMYRAGTKEFHEMRYLQVKIDDEALSFEDGGSTYDKSVGSDTFGNDPIVLHENGRSGDTSRLTDWHNLFQEFLAMESEVTTEDECA